MCFSIIAFSYFKLIFYQINEKVQSTANVKLNHVNNRLIQIIDWLKKLSHQIKERQLIKLIDEHNQAAIEIQKINLIIRRTATFLLILFWFVKIVAFDYHLIMFGIFEYFQ